MANDTEQLVILLEARIRDFERNMAKANSTAQREFGAIERRGQDSARRVEGLFSDVGGNIAESFKGIGGGIFAGGLAGLVSVETVRRLGEVVKSVADLADEAERIGLPVEDFQALVFTAHQAGLETGKVTDLFQKFNVEIGEAQVKGNDLGKILEANGVAITDANGKIRDQKSLFYDVVDLIKNAKTQQEAAIIAMAAFGRGAADALPFLQQGSEAIRDSEKAARDSGAVIDKELVKRAKEFDDKWAAAMDGFAARGKSAVLEVVSAMADLGSWFDDAAKRFGNADFWKRFNDYWGGGISTAIPEDMLKPEDRRTRAEQQLADLTAKRLELEQNLVKLKATSDNENEIATYEGRLKRVNEELAEWQRRLDGIKATSAPVMSGPPPFERGSGASASPTVIPDLSGKTTGIEEAIKRGFLDLIGYAEGTDKGRGYNETLAYGKFTGGDVNLVNMSLREVIALQTKMLANPENTFNSSAVGRYQITRTTLEDLIGKLGLSLDQQFTPQLQDKLASVLMARRGSDPSALRNEWEGLRRISDSDIMKALGNSSGEFERGTAALNARDEAMRKIGDAAQQESAGLRTEAIAMSRSTFEGEKLKKTQELLAQLQRAGVPITDAVRASVDKLAEEYARGKLAIERVEQAQKAAARSAEEVARAQQAAARNYQEFVGAFSGATKSFVGDLLRGVDAATALQNAIQQLVGALADKAIDGIFNGLFMPSGGGGASKGGGGSKALGSLLGFASGGAISGPGTGTSDSIPVAVSNGEYVVNARATSRHRQLLEAINSGQLPKFANGGFVGAPALPLAPAMGVAAMTGKAASVTVNAPVTVNGSAGTHEQNADLAAQIARELENTMRGIASREIAESLRPGNLLWSAAQR